MFATEELSRTGRELFLRLNHTFGDLSRGVSTAERSTVRAIVDSAYDAMRADAEGPLHLAVNPVERRRGQLRPPKGRPPTYQKPDRVRRRRFNQEVRAARELDNWQQMSERLYQPLLRDNVTGFYDGRLDHFKMSEIERAQEFVRESETTAYWAAGDIANLGGLNARFSNRADAANVHFKGLTDIFHDTFREAGGTVVPMRTGGDEIGAVVVGLDERQMAAATAKMRERTADYARTHGLTDIEHPKHPGEPEHFGVGLHTGYAEIVPGVAAKDTLTDAEAGINWDKLRRNHVAGEPGPASGAHGPDAGTAHTATRGDAAGLRHGGGGSESEIAGRAGSGSPGRTELSEYPSPDTLHRQQWDDKVRQAWDMPDWHAQADHLFTPYPKDGVTDYYDGRLSDFKVSELKRAQNYLNRYGATGHWVSGDIANLGGLNAFYEDRSEFANVHFKGLTDILHSTLAEAGGAVVPLRTGGDEVGAVVIGLSNERMAAAMQSVREQAGAYAEEHGLTGIEHPKHPGDPAYFGVGLHTGYAEIVPGIDVRETLRAADLGMDLSKAG
ncbi:hypothetical protein [Nocardia stercoris]|uniref:Uncharacterized protein n=1 Tax=Nocardia stercoris TaxID=2483361 RepID=A0A3M2KQP6_9NOCA|nr:hypothetical protein [Nocardia stercoris]RMI27977.1 hypothetical protein EBN03_32025 [Nocardia stercoris]